MRLRLFSARRLDRRKNFLTQFLGMYPSDKIETVYYNVLYFIYLLFNSP